MLTWISGDEKRRPEVTSSRGRSLALGDRLAVSLATTKLLPSAKDLFLSPDARAFKAFFDRGLRVERLQTFPAPSFHSPFPSHSPFFKKDAPLPKKGPLSDKEVNERISIL